jgi:hypothetical protein
VTDDHKISKKIEDWLSGAEKDFEIGLDDIRDFDSYIGKELDDIDSIVEGDPNTAYGRVMKLAGVAGHAARKRPHIIGLLTGYLHRFISIMKKVQKEMGAVSFTISVSFPFDLGISLTF